MNDTAFIRMDASRITKHRRRKFVNGVALTLSMCAMVFGIFWFTFASRSLRIQDFFVQIV